MENKKFDLDLRIIIEKPLIANEKLKDILKKQLN
jgi:hypothetical protein